MSEQLIKTLYSDTYYATGFGRIADVVFDLVDRITWSVQYYDTSSSKWKERISDPRWDENDATDYAADWVNNKEQNT
jgi:hypothetical protein